MLRLSNNIMPLKQLIRQADWHGYLLLAYAPLSFLTRRLRPEGYDVVDTSAGIQAAYAMIILIAAAGYLVSATGKSARIFLSSRPAVYLLLFITVCILSSAWSEKPLYSAYMGVECLAFFFLLTVVLDRLQKNCSAQDMIEWMVLWSVWQIVWRVACYRIRGGVTQVPFYAERLQTGIFFFLVVYVSRRALFRLVVAAFALLSGSNKMYLVLVLGAFWGVFSRSRGPKVISVVGAIALILGLIGVGLEPVLQETVFHGRAGVGMEYTTGRDRLWSEALELIAEKPFWGYGFLSGERDRLVVSGINAPSAHNMMISAALGVGILGPTLLLLYFLETTLLCFQRQLPHDWVIGFVATIGTAFVFAMTEPGLGARVGGGWVATVFVMTMIGMHCRTQPIKLGRWRAPVTAGMRAVEQEAAGLGHRTSLQG